VGTAITGIDLKAKAFLTFPDIFLDKWLPVSPSPHLPVFLTLTLGKQDTLRTQLVVGFGLPWRWFPH
jgi:hypothetical protein